MEKPRYPGVDYSDHGIAGNNENTLPQKDWQQAMDLLKECEELAGELDSRAQSKEMATDIKPLSSRLKEGISGLRKLMGET